MKIIGLTGGTGSGKGFVSTILKEKGAYIIDADGVAHEIIKKGKPAYTELVAYFGVDILDDSGEIFRKKLGGIVFGDSEKLAFLNQCTHAYIVKEIKEQIANATTENTAKCIIIDAPLLVEAGLDSICDGIWVVFAEEDVRVERIMKRDSISLDMAKARIANQKTWEEYASFATEIIPNMGNVESVMEQIEGLLQKFK
ncbi:dephospho-CoA kinase [Chakrabartyella piscis]|uniref:dephospho-CoA kinase n=1 Tax=Chakrabartyella piscis TaxID=2918914 RepID=UPI0029584FE1|nr:dephospho-CoA kinase [Chakrabartyella piscis]